MSFRKRTTFAVFVLAFHTYTGMFKVSKVLPRNVALSENVARLHIKGIIMSTYTQLQNSNSMKLLSTILSETNR